VRDGVKLAQMGIPTICMVTQKFHDQGEFTARAAGMPGIPRVLIPHPVAGTGRGAIRRVAEDVVLKVIEALEGGEK
jgi:hypothetical protein